MQSILKYQYNNVWYTMTFTAFTLGAFSTLPEFTELVRVSVTSLLCV